MVIAKNQGWVILMYYHDYKPKFYLYIYIIWYVLLMDFV